MAKQYAFKVLAKAGKNLVSARAQGKACHQFALGRATRAKSFPGGGLTCFETAARAYEFVQKQTRKNPNLQAGMSLVIAVCEVSGKQKAPKPLYLKYLANGKKEPRKASYSFPAGTVFYKSVKPLILL